MIKIKILKIILKIFLVISLCIFPLFLNMLGGTALIYNAQTNISKGLIEYSDYIDYICMGAAMLVSCILMAVSTVLVFRKKNIISVITELVGLIICMAVLFILRNIAAKNGLSDAALTPYRDMYFIRHFPTIVHSLILCILAFLQHISGE